MRIKRNIKYSFQLQTLLWQLMLSKMPKLSISIKNLKMKAMKKKAKRASIVLINYSCLRQVN